ncbi:hypothetical protein DM02DRAFT_674988, partial [Periconia macrospinosa]
MTEEYDKRTQENAEDGRRWRQQQLNWLEAKLPRDGNDNDSQITIDDSKCNELAKDFIYGCSGPLLKRINGSDEHDRLAELAVVMKQAIRAGLLMWRQPADIQIRGYQYLRNRTFAIETKEFKTHASQDNPSRPLGNGAQIALVIQPSIVVVQQGNNGEKVWSQAI